MYTCRHFLHQFGTVLFKRQWILHTRWEKKSSEYWGRQKEHVKGLGVSNTPLNVWQFFIAVPVLPRQSPQPSLGQAALLSGSRSQWAAQGWLWWSNGYKTGGRWWQGMLRTTETITEKYESETAAKKTQLVLWYCSWGGGVATGAACHQPAVQFSCWGGLTQALWPVSRSE